MIDYKLSEIMDYCKRITNSTIYPTCIGCKMKEFCDNLKIRPSAWRLELKENNNERKD